MGVRSFALNTSFLSIRGDTARCLILSWHDIAVPQKLSVPSDECMSFWIMISFRWPFCIFLQRIHRVRLSKKLSFLR